VDWLPWLLVGLLSTALVVLITKRRQSSVGDNSSDSSQLPALESSVAQLQTMVARRSKAAHASSSSFCLFSIGMDSFQTVTDAFGSIAGERLMTQMASHIASTMGASHDMARLGPGEFAAMTNGGAKIGAPLAQKLLQGLGDVSASGPPGMRLTFSIGVAVFPEHGVESVLYDHAQLAMRSVRGNGGDGFCLYDPQMSVQVKQQTQLVNDLRMSVQRREMALYFQAKIDAESLQVTACEALLRWNHPTRGSISPAVFIPLAEQHGFMGELGKWVINEACREAVKWRDKGLRMRVAVNISGAQMREEGLVDHILQTLAEHRLPPERFTCEITESIAMEDTQRTRDTFERMREAKLHVSIDDFGTGHSSLASLRKLPAAELKIDRAFVMDLEQSEDARSIAQSIVQMAKALKLRVVAEGVETAWQRDYLVSIGCSELQGYLFSIPVPAQELARMAESGALSGSEGFRESLFQATDLQPLMPTDR
jgi:diguanylate cyclase (GGDEF)-like protein